MDPVWEEKYVWPALNPDPEYGLIQESDEDNNFDTKTVPRARSFDQYRPLFSLLGRFLIFQRTLEKLVR